MFKTLDCIVSILHGKTSYTHFIPDGINANSDTLSLPGIPMLNTIIIRKDYEAAKRLVDKHLANVNIQEWRKTKLSPTGISGITPLICVVGTRGPFTQEEFARVTDMALFLLSRGADPNLKDGCGWNVLRHVVNNNGITEDEKIAWLRLLKSHEISDEGSLEMAVFINLDQIQPRFFRELSELNGF